MSLAPNNTTRLEITRCLLEDLPALMQRLQRCNPDQRTDIVRLWLGTEDEAYDASSSSVLSLCTLKELLGLLPGLRLLRLQGLVLTRCGHPIHDVDSEECGHTFAPLTSDLRRLDLYRVAIIPPFDVEILSIVELAPQLRTLTAASCHALPEANVTDVASFCGPLPSLVLPSEPTFPAYFRRLMLTFPNRAERERYHMELPWYDFSRHLSTDRGTISMELRNVHDHCCTAIKELLDDDNTTIGELVMAFEPGFQQSSLEPWRDVYVEECYLLTRVVFSLPLRLILADVGADIIPHPLPFTTVGFLFSRLPNSVRWVTLKLQFLDTDVNDQLRVLEAIPWATFDQHLTARIPDAILHIILVTRWTWDMRESAKRLMRNSMKGTAARGKIKLSPRVCWPWGILPS